MCSSVPSPISAIRSGRATAAPELAYSIHVDVAGLEPDRWYFYRFTSMDAVSPVGQLRTAPAGDGGSRLRFAVASCQHYEQGYYTAYGHLSREDIDLVAHLGDYIYEYGPMAGRVRLHDGPEVQTLAQYRNRYALYKSDPDLQEAHRQAGSRIPPRGRHASIRIRRFPRFHRR